MKDMTIKQLVAMLREYPEDAHVRLYLDDDPNVPDGTVPVKGIDRYEGTIVLVGDYPEVP